MKVTAMSLTQWFGLPRLAQGAIVGLLAAVFAVGEMRGAETSPPDWRDRAGRSPGVEHVSSGRMPLARLVRNPDDSGTGPAYALADQSGTIQRYVERVPGIDLEPYVGYAVRVRHDTGRTLLATQLELPGQEQQPRSGRRADDVIGPSPVVESLFRGIIDDSSSSPVQQAQYVAPQMPQAPVPYAPAPGAPMMMQPAGPPLTTSPVVVPYDPAGASMGGVPMATGGVVYLDGPPMCGPQGCAPPTCGPQGCPAPCGTCQPMYVQQVPCPPPAPCPPPPPPAPQTRWSLWGDVLWIHPTGVDMAHAQQQDGIGGAGTVPFGDIGVVDPDYELGFRAGGEVRFTPKESIFAQYTWFESDSRSSLLAPDIPGGSGAVGSLVHHPGAALTASAGPVDATYDIDFQIAEAAYRYYLVCTPCSEVTVFLGGRWGKLEQSFAQLGIFGGGLGGAVNTTTNIDFSGGGPIAGITGERLIDNSRFSVYGRTSAAALTGTFDSSYRMFNETTATQLALANWSDDRIVPMLDYELGVAWTGPQGHVRLAIGYMASFWFNAVTTPEFVDAVQADNYVDIGDTIAFDGAVGRVELRW